MFIQLRHYVMYAMERVINYSPRDQKQGPLYKEPAFLIVDIPKRFVSNQQFLQKHFVSIWHVKSSYNILLVGIGFMTQKYQGLIKPIP